MKPWICRRPSRDQVVAMNKTVVAANRLCWSASLGLASQARRIQSSL